MKEQFVPYEIALSLKEAGFNEPCLAFYKSNHELEPYNHYIKGVFVGCTTESISKLLDGEDMRYKAIAPLYKQATDWLEDEYGIHISIKKVRVDKIPDYMYEFKLQITDTEISANDQFIEVIKNSSTYSKKEILIKAIIEALKHI